MKVQRRVDSLLNGSLTRYEMVGLRRLHGQKHCESYLLLIAIFLLPSRHGLCTLAGSRFKRKVRNREGRRAGNCVEYRDCSFVCMYMSLPARANMWHYLEI